VGEGGLSILFEPRVPRAGVHFGQERSAVTGVASATAHPNIALAKYWGKIDAETNLPAVPSLSMTLDAMSTTTSVGFGPGLDADRVVINGRSATETETLRVTALLDRVRASAGLRTRAWVETANDFPTGAGLASSASGFAALALAATTAAGLPWDSAKVSDLARQSSASAARSIFGGFTTLAAGTLDTTFLAAEPLAGTIDWPVAISVVITTFQPKEVGSSNGMTHTRATSPYYDAWVEHAHLLFERARMAVLARDLHALGRVAEESAFAMHASAMAAVPALVYFSPVTLAVIEKVRSLGRSGLPAYVTMDAGPQVKVLSSTAHAAQIASVLREIPGVEKVVVARPGPPASVKLIRQGP
jgi:diphosphomevalonate decarboxylase